MHKASKSKYWATYRVSTITMITRQVPLQQSIPPSEAIFAFRHNVEFTSKILYVIRLIFLLETDRMLALQAKFYLKIILKNTFMSEYKNKLIFFKV